MEDMAFVYPSGKVLTWSIPVRFRRSLNLGDSLDLITESPSLASTTTSSTTTTTAKFAVNSYNDKVKSTLHGFDTTYQSLVVLDKYKARESGKIVCLINRLIYVLGTNTNTTMQALKTNLINEVGVMLSNFVEFRDIMSSSLLNTNVEWSGALEMSYSVPEFIVMAQELLTMAPKDFSTASQNNYFQDTIVMVRLVSEKIGDAIGLIQKSFIKFPQGTCSIASGMQLECLCPNYNIKWTKTKIIPTAKGGQILAFDSFAYASESSVDTGNCYAILPHNNLLLSDNCCSALRKLSDDAITVCPNVYVYNWSPITNIDELNIIDNSYKTMETNCGESSDKELKESDIYRLSLCETSVSNAIGKFTLPNVGKFLKDHLIKAASSWLDISKFSQREILIVSVCGGLFAFLFSVIILIFCIISPKFRQCFPTLIAKCCNNGEKENNSRSNRELEPVGSAPAYSSLPKPNEITPMLLREIS